MTPNTKPFRHLTDSERAALAKFAMMEISMAQLLQELDGMVVPDFQSATRQLTSYFLLPEPPVPVEKRDIDLALQKHAEGKISDAEISDWATMLMLNEAYAWPGPDEEEIADILNGLSIGTGGSTVPRS